MVRIRDQEFFQQMSPYGGYDTTQSGLTAGRIFDARGGLVGHTCRLARPIIVVRKKGVAFNEIWSFLQLNSTHAREILPEVDSMFSCPFFAQMDGSKRGTGHTGCVPMVLFADAKDRDFFNKPVLQAIYAASTGFVRNLDALYLNKKIRPIDTGYAGYPIPDGRRIGSMVRKLTELGAQFDKEIFPIFKSDLTFKAIRSLELDFLDAPLVAPENS